MEAPLKQRVLPHLADLAAGKVTARALAKQLGVSETHFSRTMKDIGFKRPHKPSRAERRALRAARTEHREHTARTLPVPQAAAAANCHPRTIVRLLARLKETVK